MFRAATASTTTSPKLRLRAGGADRGGGDFFFRLAPADALRTSEWVRALCDWYVRLYLSVGGRGRRREDADADAKGLVGLHPLVRAGREASALHERVVAPRLVGVGRGRGPALAERGPARDDALVRRD